MPLRDRNLATADIQDRDGERASLLAEVAFAMLPVLIIILTSISNGFQNLVSSPEWSFGSAVLLGQTLVKFIGEIARGEEVRSGAAQLLVATVLVLGLAPVLIILHLMLEHEEMRTRPELWLEITQIIYFFVSAFSYVVMGGVAARLRKK